jgi:hypothetical protein
MRGFKARVEYTDDFLCVRRCICESFNKKTQEIKDIISDKDRSKRKHNTMLRRVGFNDDFKGGKTIESYFIE